METEAHMSDTPHRSEAEQKALFDRALSLAHKAETASGRVIHHITVGGTIIRLVFAGPSMEALLLPALVHLKTADTTTPSATFHIWDSESTGVENIQAPCPVSCFTDRGDIWGFHSAQYRSAFHWIECSLNLMDMESNTAVYWVRNANELPYWTKASPLRSLFHWWMEKNGGQLIHAAAVGGPDGAVLITGKGGVGKSTTSLACVSAGMHYVADDYLVVTLDPKPLAHSLYNTAKLNPSQAERFPEFKRLIIGGPVPDGEKTVMSLVPHRAHQVVPSLPLRAILTPRFGNKAETEFAPASATLLQGAAAFTTLSQLPHAGSRTVDFINRMVDRLPGLEMILGHDVPRVPDAIRKLLSLSDAQLNELAKRPDADERRDRLPLVSVVIPVYNGAEFLAEAVKSVLDQNYPSLEIIVVDDGSKDDIDAAVAALPVNVRYFKQPNGGAASARNRGIKDVSGDFIAFLDVDDLWPENKLSSAIDLFQQRPDLDVIQGFGQVMQYSEQTGAFEYIGNPRESFPFYIGAAVYRRNAFKRVGLFDALLRFAEDTDWYQRAKEAGLGIERLDQVTLFVRRHSSNMTRGKTFQELNTLRVLKKALDRKRAETTTTPAQQGIGSR